MLVVAVLFASCGGGVDLSSEDQAFADEFWSNLNEFEQEDLCEEMGTASGRADGARAIEDALTDKEISESVEGIPDDPTGEEALDAIIGPATEEANQGRADRAVDIVKYLQSNC